MKAWGKEKEQERASDKVTSCPCTVNLVCSVRPSPWRLKHRPDKNATGHRPPSPPSPHLARHVPPPSYLFSRFTLRTRTRPPSSLIRQITPPPPPTTVSLSSESENAAVLLIHVFLSPSSWGNVTPGASWMISFLLCKQRHVHWGTDAALKEATSLCVRIQVCVSA